MVGGRRVSSRYQFRYLSTDELGDGEGEGLNGTRPWNGERRRRYGSQRSKTEHPSLARSGIEYILRGIRKADPQHFV